EPRKATPVSTPRSSGSSVSSVTPRSSGQASQPSIIPVEHPHPAPAPANPTPVPALAPALTQADLLAKAKLIKHKQDMQIKEAVCYAAALGTFAGGHSEELPFHEG